ncbi:MAG: DUF523 domain-containing protein [Methyloprofundus sp.]|nr:DUF523 domain-containing protein [Methyloprofundus sp.]
MLQKSIAVSACLLGHKVRYDGADQEQPVIFNTLAEQFKLIAICPEMEIGLGVPREKIELVTKGLQTRVQSIQAPVVDLTLKIQNYAQYFLEHETISGFILKDKSPSCGVENCKIKDQQGITHNNGTGVFAASIRSLKPNMPMIQSNQVLNQQALDIFIQQVKLYEY